MEKQDEVENRGPANAKARLPRRTGLQRTADAEVVAAFPKVIFKGHDGRKLITMGKWALNFRERNIASRGNGSCPFGNLLKIAIKKLQDGDVVSSRNVGNEEAHDDSGGGWVVDWLGGFLWVQKKRTLTHEVAKVNYFSEELMDFWDSVAENAVEDSKFVGNAGTDMADLMVKITTGELMNSEEFLRTAFDTIAKLKKDTALGFRRTPAAVLSRPVNSETKLEVESEREKISTDRTCHDLRHKAHKGVDMGRLTDTEYDHELRIDISPLCVQTMPPRVINVLKPGCLVQWEDPVFQGAYHIVVITGLDPGRGMYERTKFDVFPSRYDFPQHSPNGRERVCILAQLNTGTYDDRATYTPNTEKEKYVFFTKTQFEYGTLIGAAEFQQRELDLFKERNATSLDHVKDVVYQSYFTDIGFTTEFMVGKSSNFAPALSRTFDMPSWTALMAESIQRSSTSPGDTATESTVEEAKGDMRVFDFDLSVNTEDRPLNLWTNYRPHDPNQRDVEIVCPDGPKELLHRLGREVGGHVAFVTGHCFYTATGAGRGMSAQQVRHECAFAILFDPRMEIGLKRGNDSEFSTLDPSPCIQVYESALDRLSSHYPHAPRSVDAYVRHRVFMHRTVNCLVATDDKWYWNDDLDKFAVAFTVGTLVILKERSPQVRSA